MSHSLQLREVGYARHLHVQTDLTAQTFSHTPSAERKAACVFQEDGPLRPLPYHYATLYQLQRLFTTEWETTDLTHRWWGWQRKWW